MPSMLSAGVIPLSLHHPLDLVEEMLIERDMAYDRPDEDEIIAEINGEWSNLKFWYRWETNMQMFVFSCSPELRIPPAMRSRIYPALTAINEKIWLGHFDLISEDGSVIFRYSMLAQDPNIISQSLVESLQEIAVTECNRFYPVLQSALWGNQPIEEALAAAVFETCGEA